MISVADYKYYYPIICLIYVISTLYQPVYVLHGASPPLGYFSKVLAYNLILLVFTYLINGFMGLSFIYHKMSE